MNKLEKIRKIVEKSQGELVACGCNVLMKIQRILGERKLFAIVHDGTFDGDNTFYCPDDKVPFKEGQNIRDIRAAYHQKRVLDEMGDRKPSDFSPEEMRRLTDEINECFTSKIKGAWIVDEDTLKALVAVWDAADPHGDGPSYATNHTAKGMAKQMAIRHPGRKV